MTDPTEAPAPLDLSLDLEELTLGDVEDMERISGVAFANMDFAHPPLRLLVAMVYVAGRRTDPNFTEEQARAVKVVDLGALTASKKAASAAGEEDGDPLAPPSASGDV